MSEFVIRVQQYLSNADMSDAAWDLGTMLKNDPELTDYEVYQWAIGKIGIGVERMLELADGLPVADEITNAGQPAGEAPATVVRDQLIIIDGVPVGEGSVLMPKQEGALPIVWLAAGADEVARQFPSMPTAGAEVTFSVSQAGMGVQESQTGVLVYGDTPEETRDGAVIAAGWASQDLIAAQGGTVDKEGNVIGLSEGAYNVFDFLDVVGPTEDRRVSLLGLDPTSTNTITDENGNAVGTRIPVDAAGKIVFPGSGRRIKEYIEVRFNELEERTAVRPSTGFEMPARATLTGPAAVRGQAPQEWATRVGPEAVMPDYDWTPGEQYQVEVPSGETGWENGDEVTFFADWSRESLAGIQKRMEQAGLLLPNSYRLGYWDQMSQAAAQQAMAFSNRWGLATQEERGQPYMRGDLGGLLWAIDEIGKGRATVPAYEPPTRRMPDPATIHNLIVEQFQQEGGRKPTAREIARYTDYINRQYNLAFDQADLEGEREHIKEQVAQGFVATAADREKMEAGGGTVTEIDPVARFQQYFRAQEQPLIDLKTERQARNQLGDFFGHTANAAERMAGG